MSRKEKARSMYMTSSDTSIHTSSAGDRNGAVVKVPPTQMVAHDAPAAQVAPANTSTVSQPAVVPRCCMILLLYIVARTYYFHIFDMVLCLDTVGWMTVRASALPRISHQ